MKLYENEVACFLDHFNDFIYDDVYSPMKAENTKLKKQNGQKTDRLTKTTDVNILYTLP